MCGECVCICACVESVYCGILVETCMARSRHHQGSMSKTLAKHFDTLFSGLHHDQCGYNMCYKDHLNTDRNWKCENIN